MRIPTGINKQAELAVQSSKHASSQKPQQAREDAGSVEAAAQNENVRVELSSEARKLSQSGIDQAKVERLQNAIQDGSFRVNAQAIADKIVEE